MALPDPEGRTESVSGKGKGTGSPEHLYQGPYYRCNCHRSVLHPCNALGWDETALIIPLVVIAVVTGVYYQWQKQKIER